jgi:hypothetical protein
LELRALVLVLTAVSALVACGKSEPRVEAPSGGTPVATASASPNSGAGDLGIALYPGMVAVMEGQRLPGDNSAYMINSAYKSADKPEKIAAYYREQLGKKFGKDKFAEMPMGEGMIRLVAGSEEASQRFDITIRAEGDGTMMSVMAIVKSN